MQGELSNSISMLDDPSTKLSSLQCNSAAFVIFVSAQKVVRADSAETTSSSLGASDETKNGCEGD